MIQSDALSRRPDHCADDDTDNDDMVMLPDSLFVNLLDVDLQQQIAESKDYDFDVTKAIESLLENGSSTI